ncbi:hypothetical protein CONCODRAFT_7481 [Conidiobolus coronatus NRRL 28638]|uniref:Uncharacterized protein n=1 Tax=Conidiobolus coronatus (strain ATCC 28846 / CBS 209.66 / NRRL 28638) TaxID=796925 RepID=A0A137P4T9_CONC2|nr:hypothetical protein CONCODRAFT_7481 [Conidiobolus coronatus NRRL 28638]|eukprot:KXN70015.1 hypothetical protein CONCODRAFT_7481 [Conidiobolus coronatus NRRL 28638]
MKTLLILSFILPSICQFDMMNIFPTSIRNVLVTQMEAAASSQSNQKASSTISPNSLQGAARSNPSSKEGLPTITSSMNTNPTMTPQKDTLSDTITTSVNESNRLPANSQNLEHSALSNAFKLNGPIALSAVGLLIVTFL